MKKACFIISAIVTLLCGKPLEMSGQPVNFRDIIITEFMADPTPVVGLPEREFVEIYNRSGRSINLANWTVKDASTSRGTFPSVSIDPGEYAIICRAADASLFAPFGKVIAASTLPALNNDQDSIIIRTADGFTVDAIFYTDAWYRDPVKKDGGYTIELINPNLDCSGPSNWLASRATTGGTPAGPNSVLDLTPDTIPPSLTALSVLDAQTLILTFSEGMDTITGTNPNLFVFNPPRTVATVTFNSTGTIATLLLDTPLQNGVIYELNILGLIDCEGNPIVPTVRNVAIGRAPTFGELLITEIMSDPTPVVQLPEEEYFEIYNPTNDVIDLKGVSVGTGSRTATFPEGLMFPGEYAVVVPSAAEPKFSFASKVFPLSGFPTLTNTDSDLSLIAPGNIPVFHVAYSETWYTSSVKKDGGWSLEMVDISNPCGGRENWVASVDRRGGTPAELNSVAASLPDNSKPEAVAIDVIDSVTLRLVFSEKIDPSSINLSSLNINPVLPINSTSFDLPAVISLTIQLGTALQPQVIYNISVRGFSDCAGNVMENRQLSFGLPVIPEPGDIIINELLFDPPTNGEDFVELWNVSNKILTLADMAIVREDAKTGELVTFANMQNLRRLILPGQYIALSARGETVRSQFNTPGPGVFADVSGFPNYVNDGGIVALYRKDLEVLDRFPYDNKLHFRLLDNKKGVSLERVSPGKPTADRNNWTSAALQIGGATPGYQNSSFLIPQIKGGLTLSPEVFSPDQDGIDDLLSIAYSLEKPGYVGNTSIYTIEGIPVRKLLKNETLAQEGFFVWDGLDDDGRKARVGIYVVVLEVFDLDGNKDVLRGKCVVASRLR
jgi:hypothetical protein